MKIEVHNLWDKTPGTYEDIPDITSYIPENKISDCAIIIFPGGGYAMHADYEGDGYAKFLASKGITAFVVKYRLSPNRFPLPLLDARRAVRFVRFNSEKFGINKNKIGVMGSSAGGHLAALSSTYFEEIEFENIDELDKLDFIPNAQILCYPVIRLLGKEIAHLGSGANLLGEKQAEYGEDLSPDLIASKTTPPAFIWHTNDDNVVDTRNSLLYSIKLHELGISTECHIFPNGPHGLGLSDENPHVKQWVDLFMNWLKYIGFINK